ncbi:MAG: ZIP family metal transporter [Casimicrobiaceae bacterium]|nr:ZIP family metal transporter [Casimicrobiaceae bacterium]MCX8098168.1 ZIP family metal transporter [Casimicrobiaceae bacterium]MDW8312784.1 ZIP family metal transporter [Burkholderiales bacterium]
MTLLYIIIAALIGGVASIAVAALALAVKLQSIDRWVAFAVGALLAVVFLDLLPHALDGGVVPSSLLAWVLGGLLFFFVLEKLVLWRHSHGALTPPPAQPEALAAANHPHHHHVHHDVHGHAIASGRPAGLTILLGDALHNATDGVLIAAAFLADIKLGIVTSLAVIAHEIPQEVSDFFVLLHAGYSRAQAFAFNLMSSLAMVVGGVAGYLALETAQAFVIPVLAFAAASMLYVAVADLIPTLHRRFSLTETLWQIAMIALGIGTVMLTHELLHVH